MRKIPSEYDNPLDSIFINICDNTCEYFKNLNFTPNILTTISLLLAIISVILFYYDYYTMAAILFLLSYLYDCYDGHFARKYDMTTEFGCYYDHASDIFKYLLLGVVLFYKSKEKFYSIMPIFLSLSFLMMIHMGCQESFTDHNVRSDSLSYLQNLCPARPEIALNYTRFFGCGTLNLFIAYVIFSFGYF